MARGLAASAIEAYRAMNPSGSTPATNVELSVTTDERGSLGVPENGRSKSFWTTLPGVLSAGAGLIGAIAAILGALASVGVFSGSDEPNNGSTQAAASLDQVRLRWQVELPHRFRNGDFVSMTRFTPAYLHPVPAGSLITMRCEGVGCFKGVRHERVRDAAPKVPLPPQSPHWNQGRSWRYGSRTLGQGPKSGPLQPTRASCPLGTLPVSPRARRCPSRARSCRRSSEGRNSAFRAAKAEHQQPRAHPGLPVFSVAA